MRFAETILVVEDEVLIRMAIADELRASGYIVLEASNADEAIEQLDANRDIRLVFTDIDMPGSMDGLRLSRVIRDRWPPVGIIMTSGKASPDRSTLPSRCEFVPKPYSPERVVDAVRVMLG